MASDATKQTISQSLNDLKAEVADRTKSIITGVKIPELESTLLISPTDQVIVETDGGTRRVSLKTIGNVFGGGGGFDLSDYQTKHDITLNTTDKTIAGAINELNSGLTEVGAKVTTLEEKVNENHTELTEKLEETNTQLSKKAPATAIDDLQGQINNLVIDGTGDSNPEVVQARGKFSVLNDRFNSIDDTLDEMLDSYVEGAQDLAVIVLDNWMQVDGTFSDYNGYKHVEIRNLKPNETYHLKCRVGANVRAYVIKNSAGYGTRAYESENFDTRHDYDISVTVNPDESGGTLYVNTLNANYIGVKKNGGLQLKESQEVVDARYGADKVTYNTLGEAIRTQFTEIKETLNELDGMLVHEEVLETLELPIATGFMQVDGNTNESYYRISHTVKMGEKYKIRSNTGSNVRSYVIKNLGGHVTRYGEADAWGTTHDYDIELVISSEENNGTLYVNSLERSIIGLKRATEVTSINDEILSNISINASNINDGSIGIEKLMPTISQLYSPRFNPVWLESNTGYMKTDGTLVTADNNYCFVEVKKGEMFKLQSNHGWDLRLYVFIDKDKNVVSYYPEQSVGMTESSVEFTAPCDGTLYINSFGSKYMRVARVDGYKIADATLNKLLNKKAVFFGDSITEGTGSWADFNTIRLNNDMSGGNYGVGGSTYSVKSNSDNNNCIYNRIKYIHGLGTHNDANYIVLEGGVNDAFQSLPLGSMLNKTDFTTECDTSTFAGAFEMAIRYVLTNWRGAKVGFIANSKIPRLPSLGTYMDMAKEICNKYSVPVLDLFNESGICAGIQIINESYFGIDGVEVGHGGTHPTKEGYALYINDKVESWMRSL